MLLLEVAQIATGLSVLVATATFLITQVDRVRKARQEVILRWQRVIVYELICAGAADFDGIRDTYLTRSQQFSDVKIPKSELQDGTLTLIIMQLISDSLVMLTEDGTYIPIQAKKDFPGDDFKQMALQEMQKRLGYNKLGSDIYDLLDRESGQYTIDQMHRRLAANLQGFSFDDFHIHVREMMARGIAATTLDGKVWLRAKIPPVQKS